jgi:hypothetical protein
MADSDEDIVVFQQYGNTIDANIAKTKLDAYGVPCFLTEENMANLYPGQSLLAFKIRLHIFSRDRDRAARVLLHDNTLPDGDLIAMCPQCHSHKVTREFPKKLGEKLTYILFGVLFPDKKVNHCLDCDFEF